MKKKTPDNTNFHGQLEIAWEQQDFPPQGLIWACQRRESGFACKTVYLHLDFFTPQP